MDGSTEKDAMYNAEDDTAFVNSEKGYAFIIDTK